MKVNEERCEVEIFQWLIFYIFLTRRSHTIAKIISDELWVTQSKFFGREWRRNFKAWIQGEENQGEIVKIRVSKKIRYFESKNKQEESTFW